MNNRKGILSVSLLCSLWLLGCSDTSTNPDADTSSSSVAGDSTGTELSSSLSSSSGTGALDQAHRLVKNMGRGMNLGNALEAPNEGEWGVTLEENYFRMLGDSGFTNLRIPVRWDTHLSYDGLCTVDSAWMARVKWAIENTISNGMIAIVDAHHWEAMYSDPTGTEPCFLSVFKQMAQNFKVYSKDSLVIELLNEPRDLLTSTVWNNVLAKTIDTIRTIDAERTLMVGPGNWYSAAGLTSLKLPVADKNIIASFHYYDPFSFTHQGATFLDPVPPTGVTWSATTAEMRAVRETFQKVKDWSIANQRPIYLGEFGAYNAADTASRGVWTEFIGEEALRQGFAWGYWEFCSGFGVYDAANDSWNHFLMKALLHPTLGFGDYFVPNLDTTRYVVLDDFDGFEGTKANLSSLSAILTALNQEPLDSAGGTWYAYASTQSKLYQQSGDSLPQTERYKMIVADGHEGKGLYIKMNLKGESYPYTGVGASFNGTQTFDMSSMRALSFWAKGRGDFKLAWKTPFTDTCCSATNTWGKFSKEITLSADWKQYVIWSDEWVPTPYSGLETAQEEWINHDDQVTNLEFMNGQAYGEAVDDTLELWLDDVRFYGMDLKSFQ
jgi:aryl-phospho-beta-D-glucosidase BglC (GH1 family)